MSNNEGWTYKQLMALCIITIVLGAITIILPLAWVISEFTRFNRFGQEVQSNKGVCGGFYCASKACSIDNLEFSGVPGICESAGLPEDPNDDQVMIHCQIPTLDCKVFVQHPSLSGFCEELKPNGKCNRWSFYSALATEVYLNKDVLCNRAMWRRQAEELLAYTGVMGGGSPFKHHALAEVVVSSGKVFRRVSEDGENGTLKFSDLCQGEMPR